MIQNTIIRDLSGFGMEHAGPIGRSLISRVMAVSSDNYPEQMQRCYLINAPWVFFALWKGLTPLMSTNTVNKIKVLNYNFLPVLSESFPRETIPVRVGGLCDPNSATPQQLEDFVMRGDFVHLSHGGDDVVIGSGGDDGGGSGGGGEGGGTHK
ncbi:unnamed protein product, partial [Discosporangium mesarthrocarpum]